MSTSTTNSSIPRCFFSGGHDANNRTDGFSGAYKQCPGNEGKPGMCCRLNDTRPDVAQDECGANGLCRSSNNYWRESCTDPTWKSAPCVKLCLDPQIKVSFSKDYIDGSAADVPITICNDGSYCCGDTNLAEQCCNNNDGYILKDGEALKANSISSSTSNTPSPTTVASSTADSSSSISSSTTASSSPSPSSPSQAATAISTGAVVGGVVGGITALALGVVCMWLLLKRRNATSDYAPPKNYYATGMPASELPATSKPVEVYTHTDPRELAA